MCFAERRIEAMQRDSSKSLMSQGDMKKEKIHWFIGET
jgi:hypothetical protein